MVFLSVVASHAILATIDGDAHVGHGEFLLTPLPPASREGREGGSVPVRRNDVPDGAHRLIDPARRLSIAALKLAHAGACLVKFGRKPRPVDVEDMDLFGQGAALVVVSESLLQGRVQRIQCIYHPFDGLIETARAVHHIVWYGHVLAASICAPLSTCPPALNLMVIVNRPSTQTPVLHVGLPSLRPPYPSSHAWEGYRMWPSASSRSFASGRGVGVRGFST